MSVTYTALTADRKPLARADRFMPCLCTQLSAAFREAMDVDAAGGVPSFDLCLRLAGAGIHGCRNCHGKGVEVYEENLDINLANENARVLFEIIGRDDWMYGEARIAELSLTVGMALTRWRTIGVEDESPVYETHGRVTAPEMTIGTVAARAQRFADFLRDALEEGAAVLTWG